MHIPDATHYRMIFLFRHNMHRCGILVIASVVSGTELRVPRFAKDLATKATDEVVIPVVEVVINVLPSVPT